MTIGTVVTDSCMKKSKNVPATLVVAVAALTLAGCGHNNTEVRRCIDASGRVLPDSMCGGTGYSSGYGYGLNHWVYGGSYSGSRFSGYHSTPSDGADISDSAGHTISRGGFGGGSSGGGGGSGGGS